MVGADYDPEVIYNTKRSRGELWRHRIYKLREARGNSCENEKCQAAEIFNKLGKSNLQFAHIKPTGLKGMGRGQTQRFRDIVEHPDCYKLLCTDCHKELDRGGQPQRTQRSLSVA